MTTPPTQQATAHLHHLCSTIPRRPTGSDGNRMATAYVAEQLAAAGFAVETPSFDCLDWHSDWATVTIGNATLAVQPSPYAFGCELTAPLVVATTIGELASLDATDKLLLLRGELTRSQLTPKNYPFYQVEEHQQLIAMLEAKAPAAILTATGRDPQLAGSLYPFPLIEDGDFTIPSVYLTDDEGEQLAEFAGQPTTLISRSERRPATAYNVIGRRGAADGPRLVFTAHIDAKPTTPGALDNATGVTTLLLLADRLAGYEGSLMVEIAILNGEDDYSAAGEQHYLASQTDALDTIQLAVNLDGVGYREGSTAWSLYEVDPATAAVITGTFAPFPGLVQGEPWYQGDHMLFVMGGRPALALTSEQIFDLMSTIIHTGADTPDLVDPERLVETAAALHALVLRLGEGFDRV